MIDFLLKCFSFLIGKVMKVFAIVEKATTKVVSSMMMENGVAQTLHAALTKEILMEISLKFHAKEEH